MSQEGKQQRPAFTFFPSFPTPWGTLFVFHIFTSSVLTVVKHVSSQKAACDVGKFKRQTSQGRFLSNFLTSLNTLSSAWMARRDGERGEEQNKRSRDDEKFLGPRGRVWNRRRALPLGKKGSENQQNCHHIFARFASGQGKNFFLFSSLPLDRNLLFQSLWHQRAGGINSRSRSTKNKQKSSSLAQQSNEAIPINKQRKRHNDTCTARLLNVFRYFRPESWSSIWYVTSVKFTMRCDCFFLSLFGEHLALLDYDLIEYQIDTDQLIEFSCCRSSPPWWLIWLNLELKRSRCWRTNLNCHGRFIDANLVMEIGGRERRFFANFLA